MRRSKYKVGGVVRWEGDSVRVVRVGYDFRRGWVYGISAWRYPKTTFTVVEADLEGISKPREPSVLLDIVGLVTCLAIAITLMTLASHYNCVMPSVVGALAFALSMATFLKLTDD